MLPHLAKCLMPAAASMVPLILFSCTRVVPATEMPHFNVAPTLGLTSLLALALVLDRPEMNWAFLLPVAILSLRVLAALAPPPKVVS